MTDPYKYAYLLGTCFILIPVWAILFYRRKDLRKEIIAVSLVGGVAGILSEMLYVRDYWHPPVFLGKSIGIEDFLFGFFIAGIASVVYEELWDKHFSHKRNKKYNWSWLVLPVVGVACIVLLVPIFGFGMNSIYASILMFLTVSLIIVYFRKDLFFDSLFSGVIMGLFMFFGYLIFLSFFPEAIQQWWVLNNISGELILGVPIEELLWAFCMGAMMGPIYEFFKGLKFIRN